MTDPRDPVTPLTAEEPFDRFVRLRDLAKLLEERMPDGAAWLRDDGYQTNVRYGESLAASILRLLPLDAARQTPGAEAGLRAAAQAVLTAVEPVPLSVGMRRMPQVGSEHPAIEDLRAALQAAPVSIDRDDSNWLGAFVLHAEAVHGCDHTADARESAGLPRRLSHPDPVSGPSWDER